MARAPLDSVLHYTRTLLGAETDAPERLLLERFLAHREEAAFAALVERHGPMVLGVCRRLLGDAHDAEDAFQATFLALAHNAASVRNHESLGSWLYGVACRVAWRARAGAARRRACEQQAQARRPEPHLDPPPPDLADVLDEELERLPSKYRSPVVLCYLQGQTNEEAARQLGWPVGTVKGRLSRARDLLRTRLARRGLSPSAALLGPALAEKAAAPVPLGLAYAALRVALAPAAGVPVTVAALAEGAVRPTAWVKQTLAALVLLALGGVGVLVLRGAAPPSPATPRQGDKSAAAVRHAPDVDGFGDLLPAGARARLGTTRFRQGAGVSGVAYSPDGKLLASAGGDGSVCFWDSTTGRCLRRFNAHPRGCLKVVFSPSGKLLASMGWEEAAIVLWDVPSGKEVQRLPGHQTYTHAIAFSPDGKLLASVGLDQATLLWDVAAGTLARKLPDAGRHPCCVAFSPDGKRVVAGGHSLALRGWDVATGQEWCQLKPAGETAVLSAAFSRDGKLLAMGDMSGEAYLYDAATGKRLWHWTGQKGYVYTVEFSPDGKTVAVSSYRSLDIRTPVSVRLYDVSTGKEAARLRDAWGVLNGVAFAPGGQVLAAADGNAIRRWDATTGQELLPDAGHRGGVWSVAVSPDGRVACSGAHDATVRAWDTSTGKELFTLAGHQSGPVSVRLSADGKVLATTGYDCLVKLWDATTGKELRGWEVFGLRSFALSPDGRTLATGGGSAGLCFWDATTGKERRQTAKGGYFYALAFSPDGRTLACGGYEGGEGSHRVRLRDVTSDQPPVPLEGHGRVAAVAFSPCGQLLASALDDQEHLVRLYAVRGTAVVRELRGHTAGVHDVAFSADGWGLATASRDGTVRLWEVATGQERRRLAGHTGEVNAVAFSADGRTLVTGGEDTAVLVWDLADRVRHYRGGKAPTQAELGRLWEELGDSSAAPAYEAVCRLTAFPREAVALLREQLGKRRPSAGRLARLIGDLDNDDFQVRERATAELKRLGEAAVPDLRETLASTRSLEVRLRLEKLLRGTKTPADPRGEFGGLRLMRALEVLEGVGSEAAREVLESVARGKPESALTRAAAAAVKRLQGREAGRQR